MFKKSLAALAIAAVAVFAVPAAANAATYVPASDITVAGTPAPGAALAVTFDEAFQGGERVSFAVTGEGRATLAAFKVAIETATLEKSAAADGTAVVDVTLPSAASGTYTLTATGLTSGIIGTAALSVAPGDAGDSDGLPDTGADVSVLAIWAAAGALLLGAGLVVVMTMVRRQKLSQN